MAHRDMRAWRLKELRNRSIYPTYWPAFSPDLNPTEAVWNWMKDWIQEQYPNDEQLSYGWLREVVRASWDALPEQFLEDLIESMQARCQAVIEAGGAQQNISVVSKYDWQNWLANNPFKKIVLPVTKLPGPTIVLLQSTPLRTCQTRNVLDRHLVSNYVRQCQLMHTC